MPPVRSYHHGNLRATLFQHAEQVLAEGGDLSLRELARRAGVSHAAPRRHFADKQELLDELARDGFRRLGDTLSKALTAGSFDERMLAWARAYVRFATEHAALLDLMFTGKHHSPVLAESADRAFASAFTLFQEGQSTGAIIQGDLERVATPALAAFHGLAALINAGMLRAERLDEVVAEAVERVTLGLRPRSVGS
jgi:AcrR family transcriptional regulator